MDRMFRTLDKDGETSEQRAVCVRTLDEVAVEESGVSFQYTCVPCQSIEGLQLVLQMKAATECASVQAITS